MDSGNKTYCNGKKLLALTIITLLTVPNFISSQIQSDKLTVLTEIAKKNFVMGLQSDNIGVKKSYIYFAGKYKITDVSQNLLEIIGKSNNDELCQMLAWSLYQIGDDSCCEELNSLLKNHPSEKLKDFCKFLQVIREYETSFVKG